MRSFLGSEENVMFDSVTGCLVGCMTILGLFFFWLVIGAFLDVGMHLSTSVAYGISFLLMSIVAFFLVREDLQSRS